MTTSDAVDLSGRAQPPVSGLSAQSGTSWATAIRSSSRYRVVRRAGSTPRCRSLLGLVVPEADRFAIRADPRQSTRQSNPPGSRKMTLDSRPSASRESGSNGTNTDWFGSTTATHNPKVGGSNPPPATIETAGQRPFPLAGEGLACQRPVNERERSKSTTWQQGGRTSLRMRG